jgi:hypothetical protein
MRGEKFHPQRGRENVSRETFSSEICAGEVLHLAPVHLLDTDITIWPRTGD